MINLKQIRYFLAVADAEGFMPASRVLNVSQPAIGYQINELETELGVKLLIRHARGCSLTEAGLAFQERANAVIAEVNAAVRAMDKYRDGVSAEITLGVTPTAGRALVPEFLEICDGLPVKIIPRQGLSNELLKEVNAGSIDATLCYDPPKHSGDRHVPLYQEPIFLVGPPSLMPEALGEVQFRELSNYPLLLDDRLQVIRQLIEAVAASEGITLNVGLEIGSIDLKREMIVKHNFCTIVPYGLFFSEIDQGFLRAARIVSPELQRTMSVLFRPHLPTANRNFLLDNLMPLVRSKIDSGALGWRKPADEVPAHS